LGDGDENVEKLCWGTETELIANDDQEPLAVLVVHAAMHMLFLPQFTCDYYEENGGTAATAAAAAENTAKAARQKASAAAPEKQLHGHLKYRQINSGISLRPSPTSIIWAAGAGVTASDVGLDATSRKYDKNRIELLRLLLTASSDPLFASAEEYNPLASRWLAVITAADAPNAMCLFYSLLNTVLSYDPRSAGFSEGNHLKLVEISAQVLCVLLDCGLPGTPDPVIDKAGHPCVEYQVAAKGGFNIFRTLLARVDTAKDLTFIFDSFARLLRSVYEADNAYIRGSTLGCYQELLVLFWKFLEENPLFMAHSLTKCDINEIIVSICFLMYRSRRDPAQIGLVHICTFVLLKLSGERSFGVSLNRAFKKKLPIDLPLFHGCHTDLLTITLHKLVVNGAYKLVPLYSCFLTIISNISPYWKSMSLVAAVKLVNLFELFSSPKFLYSGEFAHRHLALLLEVFNNIVQYQYHGNSHLVYAIVRRKDSFGQLNALSLEKAQHDCHKVFGDQISTVRRDNNNNGSIKPSTLDLKGIPSVGNIDDASSQVSSAAATNTPFHPTEAWLRDVKESLPTETVSRLLQHLVPVVDDIVSSKQGVVDEQHILDVLNEITMVGLLPVPHPIVIRKYQPNQYTALWFTAFLWGVIFLRNQDLPLFDGQCVELFHVSVNDEEDDEE
jgi:Dyggve-Melchior-Clausen syndrome protein